MPVPRGWTVAEANAALPALSGLLRSTHASVQANRHLVHPGCSVHQPGVDPRVMLAGAVATLAADGIVLRDPQKGLVDFPAHAANGRPYWLCWLAGEPEVAWWHWVEDGFAGRTPIADLPE